MQKHLKILLIWPEYLQFPVTNPISNFELREKTFEVQNFRPRLSLGVPNSIPFGIDILLDNNLVDTSPRLYDLGTIVIILFPD